MNKLIEELEAKWKPPGIGVGSPLVRLDEVIGIIKKHAAQHDEGLRKAMDPLDMAGPMPYQPDLGITDIDTGPDFKFTIGANVG